MLPRRSFIRVTELTGLQRYQEASQHILDALALQETDSVRQPGEEDDNRGVTSSALWDSLKTCCLHLRRLDLASICDRRDLDGKNMELPLQPCFVADKSMS